jgi:predicted DNA-binding transcriptional regulator YafY
MKRMHSATLILLAYPGLMVALAKDIRTVDMQTAPYDLADLGVIPIPIETQAGRDEFTKLQLGFAGRAQQLRTNLIGALKSAYESAVIKG